MDQKRAEGSFCAARQSQQGLPGTQPLAAAYCSKAEASPASHGQGLLAFLRAVDPKTTKSLTQYARNPGRAFLKKAVGVGMFSNQAHEAQQKCFSLSAH